MFIQLIPLAAGEILPWKGNQFMATAALKRDVVLAIAEEVANGVQTAVDCWMTEIDMALSDTRLTTLGRLHAVREIVENYKHLTGQVRLDCRTLPALGSS